MTNLLRDIRDHLITDSDIVTAFGGRIYPDVVPQGTAYPYINLSDVSSSPEYDLDGEVGTHISIVTVDVWTDGTGRRAAAERLGDLVRNMLSGFKGQFGDSGQWCSGCEMQRNNILASDPLPGSDEHRRRVSMDFQITHSASVPTFT